MKNVKWLRTCAFIGREFSTCSRRQYGSVVLDPYGRLVGMGYNGSPPGYGHCVDGHCPRVTEAPQSGTSYDNCVSVHAEENALLFSDHTARRGGVLLVNGMPCFGCAKKIAASGVSRLVGIEDTSYAGWERGIALLQELGLRVNLYSLDTVSI